jgi:hypothetical protein
VLFAVSNGYFELSAVQAGEQHGVVTVDRGHIMDLRRIAGEGARV